MPWYERIGRTIDRSLGVLFPGLAAQRASARLRGRQLEALSQYWDTTDPGRLHGHKWLIRKLSPDSAHEAEGETLRERANQLYRTDGYVAGHVHRSAYQAVGTGLVPQPRIRPDSKARISEARAERLNDQLKELRRDMATKADRDGLQSLWQIERLVSRMLDKDGEALVVFSDVELPESAGAEKPLPLSIEAVSIARLETPPEKAGDPKVRLGIERDSRGVITHYWIRTVHPHDTKSYKIAYDRVPRARVVHFYEPFDADQSRGWPAIGVVGDHSGDRHDFSEATLIGQQIRACHAGFVHTEHPESVADADQNEDSLTDLEPGTIKYLKPFEKISFSAPPGSSGGDYEAFTTSLLGEEASACSMPLEIFSGRYNQMNLSVYKGHLMNARMVWRVRQQLIADHLVTAWWNRLVSQAVLAGLIDISADQFRQHRRAYTRVLIIPQAWARLDAARESVAEIKLNQADMAAREQIQNSYGGADDEETQELITQEKIRDLRNRKRVEEAAKRLGVSLEGDGEGEEGGEGEKGRGTNGNGVAKQSRRFQLDDLFALARENGHG